MARAVFKIADNNFAVWSTIVDDWIVTEATLIEVTARLEKEHGTRDTVTLLGYCFNEDTRPPLYPVPTHQPGEEKPRWSLENVDNL